MKPKVKLTGEGRQSQAINAEDMGKSPFMEDGEHPGHYQNGGAGADSNGATPEAESTNRPKESFLMNKNNRQGPGGLTIEESKGMGGVSPASPTMKKGTDDQARNAPE